MGFIRIRFGDFWKKERPTFVSKKKEEKIFADIYECFIVNVRAAEREHTNSERISCDNSLPRLWTVSKIFQFENTLYKSPDIILNISPTKVTCNNKNIILIFLILNNLNVVVVTYLLYRPTVFSPLSLVGLLYSQSPTFTLDSCLLLWKTIPDNWSSLFSNVLMWLSISFVRRLQQTFSSCLMNSCNVIIRSWQLCEVLSLLKLYQKGTELWWSRPSTAFLEMWVIQICLFSI